MHQLMWMAGLQLVVAAALVTEALQWQMRRITAAVANSQCSPSTVEPIPFSQPARSDSLYSHITATLTIWHIATQHKPPILHTRQSRVFTAFAEDTVPEYHRAQQHTTSQLHHHMDTWSSFTRLTISTRNQNRYVSFNLLVTKRVVAEAYQGFAVLLWGQMVDELSLCTTSKSGTSQD